MSAAFPGKRLVVPAGELKQRSNDTDYPFRAHSAFSHLTGWASDAEPDSVLVFEPRGDGGHDVTLYFRERADRTTAEFYSDASIGEFWIGPRPALAGVAADLGVATAHIDDVRGTATTTSCVDEDADLTRFVSELRLVKDEYEIAQMQLAVDVTAAASTTSSRTSRAIIEHPRGERIVEGVFHQRARSDGNCGRLRHDRGIRPARLLPALDAQRRRRRARATSSSIDAGVEVDSLYTADITRTHPGQRHASPRCSAASTRPCARPRTPRSPPRSPGVKFRDVHEAAMQVIAHARRRVGPAAR